MKLNFKFRVHRASSIIIIPRKNLLVEPGLEHRISCFSRKMSIHYTVQAFILACLHGNKKNQKFKSWHRKDSFNIKNIYKNTNIHGNTYQPKITFKIYMIQLPIEHYF